MHKLFLKLITQIIENKIDKQTLGNELSKVNPSSIFESDDILLSDVFLTLSHYASGEENVTETEWRFLLNCLLGNEKFSFENKLKHT